MDDLIAEYGPTYYEADLALTTGTDGGDLAVNRLDLAIEDWASGLEDSLVRRLNTPVGGIATTVLDVTGLLTLNQSYGNPAFKLLSEPLSAATIAGMREGAWTCLQQEDRITLLGVDASLQSVGNLPMLVLTLTYQITGTSGSAQLLVGANQSLGAFTKVG